MTQNDVAEFLRRLETSFHVQLVVDELVAVFRTDGAGGSLNVLAGNRTTDVIRRYGKTVHPERIKPDTHGIFLHGHDFRRGNAVRTGYCVFDVDIDVVIQFHLIEGRPVGQEGEHRQNVASAFLHFDADFGHVRRKFDFRALHRILQIDHGDVRIRAGFESHPAAVIAGVVASRGEIQQIVHAVDFIFDRHGDGLRDHFRARSRVTGGDIQCRRRNFRIFRHRKFVK